MPMYDNFNEGGMVKGFFTRVWEFAKANKVMVGTVVVIVLVIAAVLL